MPGLRYRKHVRMWEEIRRTALRLFAERGFDQTSVPDIAAAIEISPATVFRYFGTKTDIVLAPKRRQLENLATTLAAQPRSLAPREAARAPMRAWHAEVDDDELALECQHLIAATPALAVESTSLRATLCTMIARDLAGRLASATADVDARAHAIAAVWPGFAALNRWGVENGARTAQAVLEEAYGIVDAAAHAEPLDETLHSWDTGRTAVLEEVRSELHGLRERKAHRLRTDLKRAGLVLFAERGYQRTTIDDIVAKADVSRRTFFRYFASKDDVLLDGPVSRAERLRELVRARPPSEGALSAVRHALWIMLTATYGDGDPLMRDFGELLMLRPEFQQQLMRVRNVWAAALGDVLAERMHCDADALAPNAIGVTAQWASHDAQERWIANPETLSIGHCIDASFSALQRALSA